MKKLLVLGIALFMAFGFLVAEGSPPKQSTLTFTDPGIALSDIEELLDLNPGTVASFQRSVFSGCEVDFNLPLRTDTNTVQDLQGNIVSQQSVDINDLTEAQQDTLHDFLKTQNCSAASDLYKFKLTNETVNNSTTLQDDDDLTFALPTNSAWAVEMALFYSSSAAAGLNVSFSCPANAFMYLNRTDTQAVVADCGAGTSSAGLGTTTANNTSIKYYGLVNVQDAGDLTLQWAQNAADPTNTVLRRGSYLKLTRLQ